MTRRLFLRRTLIVVSMTAIVGAAACGAVRWGRSAIFGGGDTPESETSQSTSGTTARRTTIITTTSRSTTSTTTTTTRPTTTASTTEVVLRGQKKITVPMISQYPDLPTGCEVTSAAMVLQYYGSNVTAQQFAKDWITCDSNFVYVDGELHGPDPRQVFAGNPFSERSYGCFDKPIVDAVNRQDCDYTAESVIGKSLPQLCREYIDKDKPLLIWATMGMSAPQRGGTWRVPDGSLYTWIAGEHCMVLVGYDDERYYFNDPRKGTTVGYSRSISEKRYEALGTRAVYISPNR